MTDAETYEFEIGDDGLDYDILDKSYNATTQQHILQNGLKPGMKVLDVGSGAGVMTAWLARQVGVNGSVTAVDNSEEQLRTVKERAQKQGLTNIKTLVGSAYELNELGETFDVVYCRFLLHHLHSPRQAIQAFYDVLNPGGFYFGQEGIVHSMWAYPSTFAWQGYQPMLPAPETIEEGNDRDGDFGMKLFFECKKVGFQIDACTLDQPILSTQAEKKGLLEGLLAFKQTEINHGMTEKEWQKKYDETIRFIDDDAQVIAFYNSCFVAAKK